MPKNGVDRRGTAVLNGLRHLTLLGLIPEGKNRGKKWRLQRRPPRDWGEYKLIFQWKQSYQVRRRRTMIPPVLQGSHAARKTVNNKDVRKHVKQCKTCAVEGVGPSVPNQNLVVWCQSRPSCCLIRPGVKVLSSGIFLINNAKVIIVLVAVTASSQRG